jgi:hypothetical protein
VKEHPLTLSRRSGISREENKEIKEAFDWTLQIMALLTRLYGTLSDMVKAWKSFYSLNGDIGYFGDTDEAGISPNAHRSLHTIKAAFQQFQEFERKMLVLNRRCSEFQVNVSGALYC